MHLKSISPFFLTAAFVLLGACSDSQQKLHIETVGLDTLDQPLAENATQIPKCVKKDVEVQLIKEGQPVEVVEEVVKDVRAALIKSGVPAKVIEGVGKKVHTELVKEVVEQVPPAMIGKSEKAVEVEVVIDETHEVDRSCITVRQDD